MFLLYFDEKAQEEIIDEKVEKISEGTVKVEKNENGQENIKKEILEEFLVNASAVLSRSKVDRLLQTDANFIEGGS